MVSIAEPWVLENGSNGSVKMLSKDIRHGHAYSRTTHNVSMTSLRQKSDIALLSKLPSGCLRIFLANIQEVILGTKLWVLFPAIPLAIVAQYYRFGRTWIFALSLVGVTPLAERISFLTEQIASHTGPTVGGLLNATCGNVPELIIAIFALMHHKMDVVKYSLLGSILSNLLLVLGTSLLCGGLANISKEQNFDRNQSHVNTLLLLLALLCHVLLLVFQYASSGAPTAVTAKATLNLSRASSIVMLFAYFAYLFFQLKTHRQLFVAQEEEADGDDLNEEQVPVLGFWSGLLWLVGMTALVALLSEYLVGTIEASSESWGIPVSFICIILLPIVGNATEHFGAIVFAFKNKLDITLAVAIGSATQIAVFIIPSIVIFAWALGISMNLGFNLLDTSSLALTILVTAFTLQDGTSHYLKGIILLLCYIIIAACFYVSTPATDQDNPNEGIFRASKEIIY